MPPKLQQQLRPLHPIHQTTNQSIRLNSSDASISSSNSAAPVANNLQPEGIPSGESLRAIVSDSSPSTVPYQKLDLSVRIDTRSSKREYVIPTDGWPDSPQDIKKSYNRQSHDSLSGKLVAASIASTTDLRKPGNVGRTKFLPRAGSIDKSEIASPSSSRGVCSRMPDDHTPKKGSSETKKSRDEPLAPPPWSELKTKAGKERKRLPLACIACRRKKIRCSGEKPACKHCLRSRIPCVYKITTRKAAPRTDYMTMLDKRLRRMEERVIKIIPNPEASKMSNIGRASVKPVGTHTSRSSGPKKRVAEEAFGGEVNEWAQKGSNGEVARQLSSIDTVENRLLSDGAESLPAKDIQEHLSEVFFDYLYGQSYHILHKPSFMRRLKAGTVPPVLTLALCAVAARFSTHPQVSTEPAFLRGETWAKPARDIALRRYDEPNITILTVLLILGLHEFGTCQGGRSWMLGGMATRMAYALQLHRELDRDPLGRKNDKSSELSFTDREIRRRTMWACFLMDRFNSSGTERPTFANEKNIKVQLPIKEFNFRMEIPGPTEDLNGEVPTPIATGAGQTSKPRENMGVAAYLIRVIALWGRVVKYFNLGGKGKDPHPLWHPDSHLAELKRQADKFLVELPERLKYSSETLRDYAAEKLANQFLYLHIAYNQVILFLNKFAIPTTPGGKIPTDMPKDVANSAAKAAVDAATKISSLLNEATNYPVVAPFVGYCAFASSTVHVWGIFSKNIQFESSSKRNLAYNVRYISRMKKHWGMFHYMAENLKGIYRQHADLSLKGPNASGTERSEGRIFQYGDWFDKYPHGVSGTDYEDPATFAGKETGNDAALSLKSDLQSVEDFFQTLSPSTLPSQQRKVSRKHDQAFVKKPVQGQDAIPVVKLEPEHLSQPTLNQHHQTIVHIPPHQSLHPRQIPNPVDQSLSSSYNMFSPAAFPTQQSADFANGMFPRDQTFPVHELDRQFVFGAYAQDPSAMALEQSSLGTIRHPSQAQSQVPITIQDQVQHTGSESALNTNLWNQATDYSLNAVGIPGYSDVAASSAWWMPFNLMPPELGDTEATAFPTNAVGIGDDLFQEENEHSV